ncbi:response regulator transcription factor [Nonomuraea sp. NPDC046802]|uniref:response regulator transcription factor n=1 Tax=Nonomuraea sp. NPDC046802 TaxID=3154919 RepID=UPI0034116E58
MTIARRTTGAPMMSVVTGSAVTAMVMGATDASAAVWQVVHPVHESERSGDLGACPTSERVVVFAPPAVPGLCQPDGMLVLLIEDDDRIADPLTEGLGHHGFAVARARTGAEALAGAATDRPEMILLDLGLPDMDGLDVCRALRASSDVPIIMITARGEEIDRVLGLELGADDYLAKPFGVRELVARIRAVMRRAGGSAPAPAGITAPPSAADGVQHVGALAIDRRTRQVRLADNAVALTPKEFDLLAYLATDAGAVYSRQQILDEVWDPHFFGPTKTLDAHIAALRRKLGDTAWIATARGVGFRLVDPAAETPAAGRPGAVPR